MGPNGGQRGLVAAQRRPPGHHGGNHVGHAPAAGGAAGGATLTVPAARGVSLAKFATYKAKAEYNLAVLVQTLKGGGYEIGMYTFKVEKDALDWCTANTNSNLVV